MVLSANGLKKTIAPKSPFTTSRLLVGNFAVAEECLKDGLKEVGVRRFLRFGKPVLHIYPKEMSDGGLCGIELRVLQELGMCVGARKTLVHEPGAHE